MDRPDVTVRGIAYKLVRDGGKGAIFQRSSNEMPLGDFLAQQQSRLRANKPRLAWEGEEKYLLLYAAGTTAVVGIFIPATVRKEEALSELKSVWGSETELRD